VRAEKLTVGSRNLKKLSPKQVASDVRVSKTTPSSEWSATGSRGRGFDPTKTNYSFVVLKIAFYINLDMAGKKKSVGLKAYKKIAHEFRNKVNNTVLREKTKEKEKKYSKKRKRL